MKKYKLKKDLPTFKAGDKFALCVDGGLWLIDDYDEGGDIDCRVKAYDKQTLSKFPNILTDWFEAIPEQPKTVWDLKDGDSYWLIHNDILTIEIWYGQRFQIASRDCGNVFLTKEEAEKELARRKAKVILEQDTRGFKADWKNNKQNKWYVTYQTYFNGQLVAERTQGYNYGPLAFGSWEDAQASIKTHEKEWKIYLGVEE